MIRGKTCANFCANTSYQSLAAAVRVADETRGVRVVHQAKGAEALAVVVYLTGNQIQAINDTTMKNSEEKRVAYVALSRAMDHLFLIAETAETESIDQLRNLGIDVVILS
jgi:superfamily I DNA/RNA helicase